MTSRAIVVLRVLVVLRTSRFNRADVVGHTVARQAKLIDRAVFQQPRIGRAGRRMASRATFGLHRRMLVSKRPLLVSVALDAGGIGARSEARLSRLKSTMWIVTVAATHRAFQNFMMERHSELRLHFVMATGA